MSKQILVVGQGLAGTLLSFFLEEAGIPYRVIDVPGITQSSRVAAGLFNPVTGRKMVLTWQAAKLFPLLFASYGRLEKKLGIPLLHNMSIYRPFFDLAEQNDWEARQADPAYAPFISQVVTKPIYPGIVQNDFGGLRLRQSGWLNIPALLEGWRAYLKQEGKLLEASFNEEDLVLETDRGIYQGHSYKHIVYSNGQAIQQSSYWKWLPMRPVKGEILDLQADLDLTEVINRGVFLIPLPEGGFRAGSTYDQQDLSLQPTEKGKEEILNKLEKLLKIPLTLTGHKTGIRPATKDRRPVVGSHPVHKTLLVLNGLGTKGVSLAPFCAVALLNSIKEQQMPDPAISTERFFSLYYS